MAGSTLLKISLILLSACWTGYREPRTPQVLTTVTSPQQKKPPRHRPPECQEAFVRLYEYSPEEAVCPGWEDDYWLCMYHHRAITWYRLNWLVGHTLEACAPEVYDNNNQ